MAKNVYNVYMCKYCGHKRTQRYIPLRTKCLARKPNGLHVWVKIKTIY